MDNRFETMKDEEILACIRNGDARGMDFLLNKYKGLVKKKARPLYLIGGEQDDLIQEGMIGLMHAVYNFNPHKQTSFLSFADLCVSRQIYSAVKASQRKKHSPLNSYISLYSPAEDEENSPLLMDMLFLDTDSPEDMIVGREDIQLRKKKLFEKLSPFERQVLTLFLEGIGYVHIAEILGKDQKSVDNALQRIRNKAASLFI